jgi:hypothetical protein
MTFWLRAELGVMRRCAGRRDSGARGGAKKTLSMGSESAAPVIRGDGNARATERTGFARIARLC